MTNLERHNPAINNAILVGEGETMLSRAQTPQEKALQSLVFQSFRLSQGNFRYQKLLYRWLAKEGFTEDLPITQEMPQYIAATLPPQKHTSVAESEEIANTLQDTWSDLVEVHEERGGRFSSDSLLVSILDTYIESDKKYIDIGRPGRPSKGENQSDSLNDPHASWARRYIIQGESTSVPGFDAMHQALRPVLIDQIEAINPANTELSFEDIQRQRELTELISAWQVHHPGETFIPETTAEKVLPQTEDEIRLFNLFRISFRISQGNPTAQAKMFQWLSATGCLDELDIPQDIPDYAAAIGLPKQHTDKLKTVDIQENLLDSWKDLFNAKNNKDDLGSPEAIATDILNEQLEVDYNYICKKGRPRESNGKPYTSDSYQDPHASWIRRYIVNGVSTGVDGLDALHASLRVAFVQRVCNFQDDKPGAVTYAYDEVAFSIKKGWEKKHPGESFIPEEVRDEIYTVNLPATEPAVGANVRAGIGKQESALELFVHKVHKQTKTK